jgi:hypothetical protein
MMVVLQNTNFLLFLHSSRQWDDFD